MEQTDLSLNIRANKTGLDAYDREEAKRHARQHAVEALNQSGQY
jgi:hypothetical protein